MKATPVPIQTKHRKFVTLVSCSDCKHHVFSTDFSTSELKLKTSRCKLCRKFYDKRRNIRQSRIHKNVSRLYTYVLKLTGDVNVAKELATTENIIKLFQYNGIRDIYKYKKIHVMPPKVGDEPSELLNYQVGAILF